MGQDATAVPSDASKAHFPNESYITMETFRRDGTPVATPVWFVEENGLVYVGTFAKLGKVKRLRNNARVRVAPSSRLGRPQGEWREGTARILDPDAEADRAQLLLTRKHGLIKRVTDWWYQRSHGQAIVLAIDLTTPNR